MRRKIKCMERLIELLHCKAEIVQFLKDEKVISDDEMQTILHRNHTTHSTLITGLLDDCVKTDKLQLVDYEWSILPKELVKLTIVSKNAKKEWVFTS